MCVTTFEAELSNTVLFGSVHQEPGRGGRTIHNIGYTNTPVNYHSEPNAMVLALPARTRMTGANIHDTTGTKSIFKNMQAALTPSTRGAKGLSLGIGGYSIVQYDVYEIVMASTTDNIKQALRQISPAKRPAYNREVYEYFADELRGWALMLCCFDSRDAQEAAPMYVWYEPMFPNILVLPALDAHDSHAPTQNPVSVDTQVILDASRAPSHRQTRVHYEDQVPHSLAPFVPHTVMGTKYYGTMQNGDFVFPIDVLSHGDMSTMRRFMPEDYR